MAETQQVGLRLDAELLKWIRETAQENRRTFTAELTLLIEEARAARQAPTKSKR